MRLLAVCHAGGLEHISRSMKTLFWEKVGTAALVLVLAHKFCGVIFQYEHQAMGMG
jgi:hypothetical protein